MEGPTIQFVGAPCGQHGPYTFYKAFKYTEQGKSRILSLGEFFFVKITPDSGISVCELQLLWEDKNNDSQYLASLTLYFLPENTSEKRQGYHGDDELIRENDKIVMKLSDLLTWMSECGDWNYGTLLPCLSEEKGNSPTHDQDSLAQLFAANNCGLELTQVKKEQTIIQEVKEEETAVDDGPQVKVLSYPQYCRFMATLKRLEKVQDSWLKSALVCALGGLSIRGPQKVYVTFCRDTICHHDLTDHEFRQDHLAPNLKGRPRKKKSKSKSGTGDSDSNESDVSFEINVSSSTSTSRSREPSSRRHARQLAQQQDRREEAQFLENLYSFMRKRNTPIDRVPSLGFKQLDLYAFYMSAKKYGGYELVTQKRLWKHIYDKLGGNPGSTSAATCTRRHYERLLLAYERHLRHENRPKIKPDRARKVPNGLTRTVSISDSDAEVNHESHNNNNHPILLKGKFKAEEMKWEKVRKLSLMEEKPKMGLHLNVRKPKQEDHSEELRWERIRKHSLMEDKPKLGLSLGVRKTVRRELELRQKVRPIHPEASLNEPPISYAKFEEHKRSYSSTNGKPAVNMIKAHTSSSQESKLNVVQLNSVLPNVRAVPLFPGPVSSLPPSVPSNSPRSLDLKINGRPSVIQRVGNSANGMVGHPVIPPAAAHTFQPRRPSYSGPSGVIGMPPAAHSGKSYTLPPDTYPGGIKRPRLSSGIPSLPCNPFPPVKSTFVRHDADQPMDFSVRKPTASAPLPESNPSVSDSPLNLVIHKRITDAKESPVRKDNDVHQNRHQPVSPAVRLNVSHSVSSMASSSRGVARAPIFHPPADPKPPILPSLHSSNLARLQTPPRPAAPHSLATSPIRASPAAAGPLKASPPIPAAVVTTEMQMMNPAHDGNLIMPQYVHLLHPAFPQHPMMLGGNQPIQPMFMTNTNQALVYEARLQSAKLEPPVTNCVVGPTSGMSGMSYAPQLFMPAAQQPHT